jgi:hypothetical protein
MTEIWLIGYIKTEEERCNCEKIDVQFGAIRKVDESVDVSDVNVAEKGLVLEGFRGNGCFDVVGKGTTLPTHCHILAEHSTGTREFTSYS